MPLRLIAGPANAGKVELLLDRYLAALEAGGEPVLVVPTFADRDRVERDLLVHAGALLGGSIETFDDLFDSIAGRDGARPLGRAERSLLVRRVLATAELGGFSESAARGGFAESLLQAFDELEAGLLEPAHDIDLVAQRHGGHLSPLRRRGRCRAPDAWIGLRLHRSRGYGQRDEPESSEKQHTG